MQVNTAVGILGPTGDIQFLSAIENAAEATNWGIEVDGAGLVTDNFTVGFGVGYLHAEFDTFEDAFIDGAFVDLSGAQIPNAPSWTANADAQYEIALREGRNAFLRAEWFVRSENMASIESLIHGGFPYEVPGFNQVNLRAGITSERYDITAY